ncbi:MAG: peptidylprolyl isomerase [Hyphomicrobiales bacterium]
MAVIGKIRKQSTLLLVFIGLALAAFIVGDFIKRSPRRQNDIGEIAGETISLGEFSQKLEQNISYTKAQQRKNSLTSQERFRVVDRTWNDFVRQIIMGKEYEAVGLYVSTEELNDMTIGDHPHPAIVSNFSDPNTGKFDKELVKNFLMNFDQLPAEQRNQWRQFEKGLKEDRLNNKFNTLIAKGFYVPNAIAKKQYEDENTKATVKYVAKKYSTVADSLVSPTEADYKKYYEPRKLLYKQDANRDIEYVVYDVKPSAEDKDRLDKEMNEIFEDLKGIELANVPAFINTVSDSRYDSTWKKADQLPFQIDTLKTATPGSIVKPYFNNGAYYLAELVAKSNRSDSLKANHILISYQGLRTADTSIHRTKEEAKMLADSLLAVAKKSPKKFNKLASQFSDDPSAKQNNGDLGWFTDGAMVYNFNEFIQNGKKNEIGVTETPFGYHVIQIADKNQAKEVYRIAMVERKLEPSDKTFQNTYQMASKFAAENRNIDQFNKTVEDEGLNSRTANSVKANAAYIAGLDSPREIIKWAFNENTETGAVSDVFEMDKKYVVAVVSKKKAAGIPPLAEIKDDIKKYVIDEKKGEYLAAQMKGDNLNEIGREINGDVEDVNSISFTSRNIPGFGMENKVIGNIFASKEGALTKAIIGNSAAFKIKVEKIIPATEKEDLSSVKTSLQSDFSMRVNNGYLFRALEDKTEIKDHRILFY